MPGLTSLIAQWGYAAIFLIVVLGNVGVPVPEETALIVAGYLVWQGRFRLPLVLAVGIVSAVAGDNMGYWLGRRYGQGAVERIARWGQVRPERLEAMQGVVARYGPLGVFVGRFLPGLRFLAGPLAGATGLGFRPFFVANVLGAALFVPYGVGLGYAIGYGLGPYRAESVATPGGRSTAKPCGKGGLSPGLSGLPGSRGMMATPFRHFYENLLVMVREGVPAAVIVDKIRRDLPDLESRKQLLGHLRDSRNAFEAEGKEEPAESLEQVIKALEKPEVT